MLFLIFKLNNDIYALEATKIAEVLPLLTIKEIPKAPIGVSGLINYRSKIVPVIDLCEMTLGRKSNRKLSTRLLIVHYISSNGLPHLLGIAAEHATETMRIDSNLFNYSGISIEDAPYLGPIAHTNKGLIQWLEINKILTPEIYRILFNQHLEIDHL